MSLNKYIIKFNILLIKIPLLIPFLIFIITFAFNSSAAYCSNHEDWAGNRTTIIPENAGLWEAAKANRSQCSYNFKDHIPNNAPGTGLLEAAIANRDQCASNFSNLNENNLTNDSSFNTSNITSDINDNNTNDSSVENLVNDIHIVQNLNIPDPVMFYNNIDSTILLLEKQHNIIAQNTASQLVQNIQCTREISPEMELKSLVSACMNNHDSKPLWSFTIGDTLAHNNIPAKIVGYNHWVITNENSSVDEKIIRAHINVYISLQNTSITKAIPLQDLLNNEPLYDHLFQKHFPKKI